MGVSSACSRSLPINYRPNPVRSRARLPESHGRPHQPTSVLRGMSAPMRRRFVLAIERKMIVELETSTCAAGFGPAIAARDRTAGVPAPSARNGGRTSWIGRFGSLHLGAICQQSLDISPTTRRSPPQSGSRHRVQCHDARAGCIRDTRARRKARRIGRSGDGFHIALR